MKNILLILVINVFISLSAISQVMNNQRLFFTTFFDSSQKAKYSCITFQVNSTVFIGDSSDNMRTQYGDRLPKKTISFYLKLKPTKMDLQQQVLLKEYFLFVDSFRYEKILDSIFGYSNLSDYQRDSLIENRQELIDSIYSTEENRSREKLSNHFYLYKKKGREVYFYSSLKTKRIVKIKCSRSDTKLLKKLNLEITDLEVIKTFFAFISYSEKMKSYFLYEIKN